MGTIASLLGYVLNYLYSLVNNYGLAIILFSILLKLVMLPISIKQQTSMKKTAKVQKEMNKLQIKYKNNPEKLNQEVMALYKKEKVSPFSGCIGSILQFVIFLSVFYLVSRPLTYMKKVDQQLIADYSQEITENGENSSYKEIAIIENKSSEDERVYLNMNFWGLSLSKVPMKNLSDFRVLIIPCLYVIVTFINIKISTNLNTKKSEKEKELTNNKDEEKSNKEKDEDESVEDQMESMQQMTKSMNYMMPIMSISIGLIAPLGLSLYWLVSNSLQLIERIIINNVVNKREQSEEQ